MKKANCKLLVKMGLLMYLEAHSYDLKLEKKMLPFLIKPGSEATLVLLGVRCRHAEFDVEQEKIGLGYIMYEFLNAYLNVY